MKKLLFPHVRPRQAIAPPSGGAQSTAAAQVPERAGMTPGGERSEEVRAATPDLGLPLEHGARPSHPPGQPSDSPRYYPPKSGIVLSGPAREEIRASESYSAADCPCCYRPLIVSWKEARPASDVLQDAFGCDPADLYRFFEPDEWLQRWELPLALTWGTAADWRAIAGIWRATRARREGGFMSLADIARGTQGGPR